MMPGGTVLFSTFARKLLVGALALVGLLLPTLAAAPATATRTAATATAATAFSISPGATFNDPLGVAEARWRILRKIESGMDNTCVPSCAPNAPETIMISTYLMDRTRDYDKLHAAHRRGASVQVLMDSTIETDQSNHLVAVLGRPDKDGNGEVNDMDGVDRTCDGVVTPADSTDVPAAGCEPSPVRWSYAVKCVDSCRGGRGNNHVKFYGFSQAGATSDVLMVSSANINAGGAVNGWNDLWTTVGDREVFDFYARVHHDMAEDDPSGDDCAKGTLERCAYKELTTGNLVHRVFPKTSGTDPSMDQLDQIRCKGVGTGAGRDGRTVIKIAMFWWSGTRGMALARKVIELDRAGCDVQINYGAPSGEVSRLLRTSAHQGGVQLWDSRQLQDAEGKPTLRVHHKFMIMSGRFGADTTANNVFAGTQNWINGALRQSDENTLEIHSTAAYRAYSQQFEFIKRYARKIG